MLQISISFLLFCTQKIHKKNFGDQWFGSIGVYTCYSFSIEWMSFSAVFSPLLVACGAASNRIRKLKHRWWLIWFKCKSAVNLHVKRKRVALRVCCGSPTKKNDGEKEREWWCHTVVKSVAQHIQDVMDVHMCAYERKENEMRRRIATVVAAAISSISHISDMWCVWKRDTR